MEPVTSSLGIYGVTLLASSLANALVGAINGSKQRALAVAHKESQEAFQVAFAEKRWAETVRLQEHLFRSQRQHSIQLQELHFKRQMEIADWQQFSSQSWPLIEPPQLFRASATQLGTESFEQIPLRVVLGNSVRGKDKADADEWARLVRTFVAQHYPLDGNSPVVFYDKGWKPEFEGNIGQAQVHALHRVLAGLPTLVLLPRLYESEFILEVAYWGLGDVRLPSTRQVVKLDMARIHWHLLQTMVARRSIENENFGIPSGLAFIDDANFKSILAMRDALRQTGMPEERIEELVARSPVVNQLKLYKESAAEIRRQQVHIIAPLVQFVVSTFADVYYFFQSAAPPVGPSLFSKGLSSEEGGIDFHPHLTALYEQLLSTDNLLSATHKLLLPQYDIELALQFIDAGRPRSAQIFLDRGAELLCKWLFGDAVGNANIPDQTVSPFTKALRGVAELHRRGMEVDGRLLDVCLEIQQQPPDNIESEREALGERCDILRRPYDSKRTWRFTDDSRE